MIELILLYGAIAGGIYSLLALGFTLIYGVAGVTNLAHGSFFMLGAYMVSAFSFVFFKFDPILSVIFAVVSVSFPAATHGKDLFRYGNRQGCYFKISSVAGG